jgi:hypothetical protein
MIVTGGGLRAGTRGDRVVADVAESLIKVVE